MTRKPFRASIISAVAILAGFILAVSSYAVKPGQASKTTGFSVESWNMEWFPSGYIEVQPDVDEQRRIREAATFLKEQGLPDVLMVQEIRDWATCTNLAAHLSDKSFKPVAVSEFWYDATNRSLQQLAIFSRLPCIAQGYEPWHASSFLNPPRGYAWAILKCGQKNVAFVNVHLKSNYIAEGADEARQTVLNRLKRQLSADQALEFAQNLMAEGTNGVRVDAVIIAGDFNTALEDERFAKESTLRKLVDAGFLDAFDGIPESKRPTLPANDFYPAATFDHIFAKGLKKPEMREVLPSSRISDHSPIRVVFPK